MKLMWLGVLLFIFLVKPAQEECMLEPLIQKQQSCYGQIYKQGNNQIAPRIDLSRVLELPEELLVHCLAYDPLGYATGILWSKISLTRGGAAVLAQALLCHVQRYKDAYVYGAHALFLKKIVVYLRYVPQQYASNPNSQYVKNLALLSDALYTAFYIKIGSTQQIEVQRKKIFVNNREDLALSKDSFKRVVNARPAHALSLWYTYLVFSDGNNVHSYCSVLKPLLPLSLFPKLLPKSGFCFNFDFTVLASMGWLCGCVF